MSLSSCKLLSTMVSSNLFSLPLCDTFFCMAGKISCCYKLWIKSKNASVSLLIGNQRCPSGTFERGGRRKQFKAPFQKTFLYLTLAMWRHFLPNSDMNSVCLVNRVDKLTLVCFARHCLLCLYADYNHLMNSFVVCIIFCNGSNKSIAKATFQLFLLRCTVMCFTCNFITDMFYELFYLLNTKYGIKVETCHLCTSEWTYRLLSRIGD